MSGCDIIENESHYDKKAVSFCYNTRLQRVGEDSSYVANGIVVSNCRCAATVKIKPIPGLDLPAGQRASSEGPVSARTNFQSFLDRQDAAWQDDVLGPGRAKLYRAEKLTLNQLLTMDGNALSLDALRKKYA